MKTKPAVRAESRKNVHQFIGSILKHNRGFKKCTVTSEFLLPLLSLFLQPFGWVTRSRVEEETSSLVVCVLGPKVSPELMYQSGSCIFHIPLICSAL